MIPTLRRCRSALAPLVAAAVLAGCEGEFGRRAERPEFAPDLAWSFVVQQMAFGPRHAGHQGHARGLAWLGEQLDVRADTVVEQPFTHAAAGRPTLRMTNLVARYRPEAAERVVLLAHWDTRRHADQSGDPGDRDRPVPGANDGASATAVLLALATMFREQAPPVGVDVVFTDGDDHGPGADAMYLGTRHYLANPPPGPKPAYALVLDMVGERRARFPREAASLRAAPELVRRVWGIAGEMRLDTVFVADSVPAVVADERVRLLGAAGIPAVLVTDPEYGPGNRYWHTVDDQVPRLARETLGQVGEVVAEVVYRGIPKPKEEGR